jgi:hypothetical protein
MVTHLEPLLGRGTASVPERKAPENKAVATISFMVDIVAKSAEV